VDNNHPLKNRADQLAREIKEKTQALAAITPPSSFPGSRQELADRYKDWENQAALIKEIKALIAELSLIADRVS
jgi:hypothetical protein